MKYTLSIDPDLTKSQNHGSYFHFYPFKADLMLELEVNWESVDEIYIHSKQIEYERIELLENKGTFNILTKRSSFMNEHHLLKKFPLLFCQKILCDSQNF